MRVQNPVLLIISFVSLVLGGCASKGGPGALPEWVLSPPVDTSSTIYGVGEGIALRGARDDALAVIAGKLETHVTSDVQTETVLADGQETSKTRNRVRTTTESLKLTEFRTVNSAQAGNRLFVLLSVDRQTLVDSMLEDVDRLGREIEARLADVEGSTRLKYLYRLTLARPLISEAVDKILLAQSAGQDSGLRQAALSRYQSLLDEGDRLQQSLTLAVTWDPFTSDVGEKLLTMLLELGLRAEVAGPGQHYDGAIAVRGDTSSREIFDEYHVQLKAKIALNDDKGSEISSARYQAAASSLTDFDMALKTTNRLIADEIHEQGLWRALNMHKEP
ncbi:LPP20 family lipoprotein [Marinobacter aromaticivorans]|uniref:LPP20 family lipoprotein n=1 Tax=Marinobacter aromaticivorans TaxID=1494078 RepID=A0ABW2IU30_9GAMM|nr:LPP20 family lipoprotein [Marinobacter aromaticivorans]